MHYCISSFFSSSVPETALKFQKQFVIGRKQCDQKKIAQCLYKLPKNNFTRKMTDFTTLPKLPKTMGDLGKLIVANGFKKLLKVQ